MEPEYAAFSLASYSTTKKSCKPHTECMGLLASQRLHPPTLPSPQHNGRGKAVHRTTFSSSAVVSCRQPTSHVVFVRKKNGTWSVYIDITWSVHRSSARFASLSAQTACLPTSSAGPHSDFSAQISLSCPVHPSAAPPAWAR